MYLALTVFLLVVGGRSRVVRPRSTGPGSGRAGPGDDTESCAAVAEKPSTATTAA